MKGALATQYRAWWEQKRGETQFPHHRYELDLSAIRFHQKAGATEHERTVWGNLIETLQEPFPEHMGETELSIG